VLEAPELRDHRQRLLNDEAISHHSFHCHPLPFLRRWQYADAGKRHVGFHGVSKNGGSLGVSEEKKLNTASPRLVDTLALF